MSNGELYAKVNEIIQNDIKPFIEADGGRINLVKVENNVVFVRLAGACAGCPAAKMTLEYGVAHVLKSKLKDVKSVELLN